VLYDPHGVLARFITKVQLFHWEPLQSAANAFTSAMLMLATEAPLTIASALEADNAAAGVYETTQLFFALTRFRFVAVQQGVMVQTTSTYLRQAQDAVGTSSRRTQLHCIAGGIAKLTDQPPTLEVRGLAAMSLFTATVEMLQNMSRQEHLPVTMETAQFDCRYVVRHPGYGSLQHKSR
jgi:hypothetical protein